MRVEEIALRSEIRQMLNEAGFNKNTLKDLVKEVLKEELNKAIKQAIAETNCDIVEYTNKNIDSIINKTTERVVKERITDTVVGNYFKRMRVDVQINPIMSYNAESEEK
jgi:ribonucleotide reductase alpha subunit